MAATSGPGRGPVGWSSPDGSGPRLLVPCRRFRPRWRFWDPGPGPRRGPGCPPGYAVGHELGPAGTGGRRWSCVLFWACLTPLTARLAGAGGVTVGWPGSCWPPSWPTSGELPRCHQVTLERTTAAVGCCAAVSHHGWPCVGGRSARRHAPAALGALAERQGRWPAPGAPRPRPGRARLSDALSGALGGSAATRSTTTTTATPPRVAPEHCTAGRSRRGAGAGGVGLARRAAWPVLLGRVGAARSAAGAPPASGPRGPSPSCPCGTPAFLRPTPCRSDRDLHRCRSGRRSRAAPSPCFTDIRRGRLRPGRARAALVLELRAGAARAADRSEGEARGLRTGGGRRSWRVPAPSPNACRFPVTRPCRSRWPTARA